MNGSGKSSSGKGNLSTDAASNKGESPVIGKRPKNPNRNKFKCPERKDDEYGSEEEGPYKQQKIDNGMDGYNPFKELAAQEQKAVEAVPTS